MRERKTQSLIYSSRKLEPPQRPNITEIIRQIIGFGEGRILCVIRTASSRSEPVKQAHWNHRNNHAATSGTAHRDMKGTRGGVGRYQL